MAKDVIMPVLGMNQDTAVLLSWLKQEGERVEQGEPIMEVETDKATMELDAPATGTLARVAAAAGDEVKVGSVIAVILADGEAGASAVPAPAADREAPRAGTPSGRAAPDPAPAPKAPEPAAAPAPRAAPESAMPVRSAALLPDGRVLASPKARRLAQEHGVALAALSGRGSGPDGAVLAADVLRAAEAGSAAVAAGVPASRWASFERSFDAGALQAALASAARYLARTGGAAPTLGDLVARFLGAVWRAAPLAPGPAPLRYRSVADGQVAESGVADVAATGLPDLATARAAAAPAPATPRLSLLDLSRSRVDLSGELPGADDGALVQVVVGRLEAGAEGVPRLTLRLAFDPGQVELAAAAAWADRVLALAEDPAALALLY